MHVAAQAGQTAQVELLAVYGADPGARDANGRTPIEYAKWVVQGVVNKWGVKFMGSPQLRVRSLILESQSWAWSDVVAFQMGDC